MDKLISMIVGACLTLALAISNANGQLCPDPTTNLKIIRIGTVIVDLGLSNFGDNSAGTAEVTADDWETYQVENTDYPVLKRQSPISTIGFMPTVVCRETVAASAVVLGRLVRARTHSPAVG